jgi:hypothetical protein
MTIRSVRRSIDWCVFLTVTALSSHRIRGCSCARMEYVARARREHCSIHDVARGCARAREDWLSNPEFALQRAVKSCAWVARRPMRTRGGAGQGVERITCRF